MSDGARWVLILNGDKPTPTYHRVGWVGVAYTKTACGQWWREDGWLWTSHLRRDHADMFARPCGRCFPKEGDDE